MAPSDERIQVLKVGNNECIQLVNGYESYVEKGDDQLPHGMHRTCPHI